MVVVRGDGVVCFDMRVKTTGLRIDYCTRFGPFQIDSLAQSVERVVLSSESLLD